MILVICSIIYGTGIGYLWQNEIERLYYPIWFDYMIIALVACSWPFILLVCGITFLQIKIQKLFHYLRHYQQLKREKYADQYL